MTRLLTLLLLAPLGLARLHAENFPGLHEPLTTVTQQYLVIQQKLAASSFDGVPAAAAAMKTAMTAPGSQPLETDFVQAVTQLAAAPDLHSARVAFQAVSNDLIAALAQDKAQTGVLHSAYCPMVKAYWVQTDGKKIENPYYGVSMPDCGVIQRQF